MDPPVHQAAFHSSPFPSLIVERRGPGDFYILDVNSAARKSGAWRTVREQDVIGRDIADVFPGVRAAGQIDLYEQALANQETVDLGEIEYEDADIPSGAFRVHVIPLDESRLLLTGENVTSRGRELGRDAEIRKLNDELTQQVQELDRAKRRYDLALAATTDGVWDWDILTDEEYFSPRWCEILGYTDDDPELPHTYESWASRIHPDDRGPVEKAVQDHLEHRTPYDVVYRHRHRSGEYRWQNSRGRAVFDDHGKPIRMVGAIRDITELKEEEQRRVEVEGKLRAEEAATRELEAFSDSLSHDLKSPLVTVIQFSQLLDEALGESLDDQQQDHLQRVRAAGRRMTHIIDDLRDLADVNRVEISREEVDLSSLGRDIIDDLRALVPDRDVSFEVEPGITAVGDKSLLRILLTNLLQNAWKYTGPSDDARIELGVEEGGSGVPTYYVRDNGIGFDNEDRERIFLAFERLHDDGEFSGSGLGLATVERIVRRHGGRVWAEGTPVFRFTLGPAATGDVTVVIPPST